MHVTFESNIVLLCKLDTYNAQVRPNLLYLVVETWVIMFIVAEKVRGSRPGCLAWQVKMMAQTKMETLVLHFGVGRGAYDPPRVKPYCFETSMVIAAQKMVRTSRDICFLIYQSFWYRELKEIEKLYWNGMAFVVLLI